MNINETKNANRENENRFDNINSAVINNQDNFGSFLVKKNDVKKKLNAINLASCESKYEGEFGQSNLDQIKELEDKNKSSAIGENLVNQINKENKNKKNLEDLNF